MDDASHGKTPGISGTTKKQRQEVIFRSDQQTIHTQIVMVPPVCISPNIFMKILNLKQTNFRLR